MNNKRGVMWLILGCISMIKAAFTVLQNRIENIVQEVLMAANRPMTVFYGLFGKIVVFVSLLSVMTGTAVASVVQDQAYSLFKLAIQPFLDLLTWPAIPGVVAISALAAFAAPLFGETGEAAKKQILHYVSWGIYVEIFLVIFWAFMKLIGMLGGHTAQ